MKLRLHWVMLFGLCFYHGARTCVGAESDSGSYHFDYVRAGHHITVWYYLPEGAKPSIPVVFVMHGVKRNGEDYLNDWISFAKEKQFLLVVPEFSQADFPGDEGYIYGNTVDVKGKSIAPSEWSFSMIEPVF